MLALACIVASRGHAQAPAGFVPPVLTEKAQPDYPLAAQQAGIEGQVTVELNVDPTGAVADVTLKSGLGHGLDEAALAAARRLRFSPGQFEGKPVAVKILYRFTFALPKPPPPAEPEPEPLREPVAPSAPAAAAVVRLRGDVIEAGTRAPLHGAQLTVVDGAGKELGRAEVDERAQFELKLADDKATELTVIVSALDHKTARVKEKLKPGEVLKVRYALRRNTYARYESTVRGAPVREEIARVTLDGEELRRIPGTRGDALAATFNLPSVARAPLDFGQLILRGSGPGQSAPFLLGMEIPQAFHFAGLTSTFNSYLLERFELIPSNFSARYGRLTGGVIEIVPRAGKTDRIHGDIKVDLIDAHLMLEGPLGKGSFALAARRSYVDAILSAAKLGPFTLAPRYYDYQAMLDYPVLGGKLKVMFYGSDDDVALILDDAPDQDPALRGRFSNRNWFHGLFVNYKKTIGNVDIDTTFLVAPQLFSGAVGQAANFRSLAVQTDWRFEARWRVSSRFLLVAGLDLQSGWYWVELKAPRPVTEEGTQPPFAASEKLTLKSHGYEISPALYLIANLKLTDRFTFEPGVRFDWFSGNRDYTYPQPRLQARYEVYKNLWMKGALGFYVGTPEAPTDNSVLGNPRVRAQQALHATLGIEGHPIPRYRPFRFELNVFYKHLWKIGVGSDRNVIRDGKIVPEVYIDEGEGRVYGADLLLKHDGPRWLYGWISYTIMRSERRDHPGEGWRRFQYDQTHILTLVLGYHLPWEVDVGLRLRYATGNPSTPIVGSVYLSDYDVYLPIPGAAFSERLPDFFSLDLRIDKRFVFKSWILSVYIDVANVMNRRNVEAYNYSYDYTRRAAIGGLPILPSLGLRASF